jgi:hypothetical protein
MTMNAHLRLWTTLAALLSGAGLLGFGSVCYPSAPPPPRLSAERRAALIANLGSEDSEVRAAASEQLLCCPQARPELRRLLSSPDAEVRRLARRTLDRMERRRANRALQRAIDLGQREGAIDRMLERLVRWAEWDNEDAGWQAILVVAGTLTKGEKQRHDVTKQCGKGFFAPGILKRYRFEGWKPLISKAPRLQVEECRGLVRGNTIVVRKRGVVGLMLARSDVTITGGAVSAVLLSKGSVQADHFVNALVLCDGDLEVRGGVYHSLLIARGTVKCYGKDDSFGLNRVVESVILSGSTVAVPDEAKRTQTKNVWGRAVKWANVILENQSHPLGLVRFFELSQAGVEVAAAPKGVRITRLVPLTAFGRSDLRLGDVVTAVGGEVVSSADSFRRLLRRWDAEEEPIDLHFLRAGKRLCCKVRLED